MFLERVDREISKAGITRSRLLKTIGLNHNSFNAWESRGTIPGGDIIAKIAKHFNVTTDYLLGNTDDPTPPGEKSAFGEDDLKFALFGTTDIDDDVMDDVKRFAEFTAQRKKQRNGTA